MFRNLSSRSVASPRTAGAWVLPLACALLFAACSKSDPAPDTRLARMQQLADSVRADVQSRVGVPLPGMHFYLQSPQGTYFVSAAANASSRLTSSHWLRFASVTKIFTSAAMLNMAEDGWLNLDDVITDNIPGSNIPYVPNTAAWNIPYKSQITLRQLMSHRAGVYDADNDVVPSLGDSYTNYMLALDPNHTFATEQYTQYLTDETLSYFPPGEGYHYSNTGYSMLSVIISRVYSFRQQVPKTFSQYMTEVLIPAVPAAVNAIRFPDQAADNRVPQPGCDGFIYNSVTDTSRITTYNPTITIGEGNGQGTLKGVHDWIRSLYKAAGPLNAQSVQMLYTPLMPDYSNTQYTYGSEVFDGFGRGHTGARAGNLTLFSYNAATDISIFAYFPFWDLTDGRNSLIGNGLLPLFTAADLLVQVAQ